MPTVTIVSTGFANTASVATAFRRQGYEVSLTTDPKPITIADRVVLPGVGTFAAGMELLRATGIDDAIHERVNAHRPLLAICLGLQLLCESSAESPGIKGLGIITTQVQRLPPTVVVPQFGWNYVEANTSSSSIKSGYAYYANSYCIPGPPLDWTPSLTTHGTPFAAALEKDAVLACQFHPELSGNWGTKLLQRWLIPNKTEAPC